jgi:outer membrane protein TolC
MINRSILVFFVLCASFFQIKAQETFSDTTILNLSLDQAVNMAIERNRTIQNASIDIKKAEATRWESISSMLPQVSGTIDYSNLMGYEMNLMGTKIAMPPYGTLGITAAVGLSGAQVIGAQIGTISMKMADVNYKQNEQEITNQVKVFYYSALVAQETVSLLEKNLESIKKLYEYACKSVEVGVSEQTDADQIKVQVATVETTLSSSKRSLEMVFNSMRLYLNIGVNTEIVLTQGVDDLMSVGNAMSLLSQDFILNNNYSYQLVNQSTLLSKKQVDLAGWAYGPTLSMYYQYSAKKYFSDEMTMNMTPPNMIGLSLSVPIFSSGNKFNSLRKAKLSYQQQQNTLADTEMTLKIQHRQLKYNLTSALERFETQKENVEVTQRVFDNIGRKYEYGMSSSLDVTNSGTNLITAQSSYVQALLEFVQAQIELEKLLNR